MFVAREASKLHVCGKKMATQIWANVQEGWTKKRMGILMNSEDERAHQMCSFMWAYNFWIISRSEKNLEQMLRDLIEETGRWDVVPKPTSLWWASPNHRNSATLGGALRPLWALLHARLHSEFQGNKDIVPTVVPVFNFSLAGDERIFTVVPKALVPRVSVELLEQIARHATLKPKKSRVMNV